MKLALLLSGLIALSAHADEKRIYQIDSVGNPLYNKPSQTIQNDGRIIQTDPYGNKQYDQQQYQIKGDRVYQTDTVGNIQHNKPSLTIK